MKPRTVFQTGDCRRYREHECFHERCYLCMREIMRILSRRRESRIMRESRQVYTKCITRVTHHAETISLSRVFYNIVYVNLRTVTQITFLDFGSFVLAVLLFDLIQWEDCRWDLLIT